MDCDRNARQRSTGHNSGFKKWRLTSKIESMCNKFTFVSGDSDEFQIPPLLKPANRYTQPQITNTKDTFPVYNCAGRQDSAPQINFRWTIDNKPTLQQTSGGLYFIQGLLQHGRKLRILKMGVKK